MRRQNIAEYCGYVKMCGEQGCSQKGALGQIYKIAQFFSQVFMLPYLVLQDINYCIRPGFVSVVRSIWPHNNRTNLYNFRFVLKLVCF